MSFLERLRAPGARALPWRSRFVRTARAHAPVAVPSRVRAVLAIQQLAAPIAFAIVALVVALVVR